MTYYQKLTFDKILLSLRLTSREYPPCGLQEPVDPNFFITADIPTTALQRLQS